MDATYKKDRTLDRFGHSILNWLLPQLLPGRPGTDTASPGVGLPSGRPSQGHWLPTPPQALRSPHRFWQGSGCDPGIAPCHGNLGWLLVVWSLSCPLGTSAIYRKYSAIFQEVIINTPWFFNQWLSNWTATWTLKRHLYSRSEFLNEIIVALSFRSQKQLYKNSDQRSLT